MSEWEGSTVMTEFLKIAEKSGLISPDLKLKDLGNPKEKTPVKTRNESTEDYELKVEDLINKAHPKPAWMAENSTPVKSMGDGSLVENVKEQQEKDIEVATKTPRGTLIGVHAELINSLIKLANSLEDQGKIKEAKRVDEAVKKLHPFVKGHLHKEAAWFLVPMLLASGFSAAKLFGHMLTSKQENLLTDLTDLYEKLQDYSDRSKSAMAAGNLINPFLPELQKADLSTKEGSDQYSEIIENLNSINPKLKQLIQGARQDIKEPSDFLSKLWGDVKDLFGFEDYKLLQEKFDDYMTSFNMARAFVNSAKQTEEKVLSDMGGFNQSLTVNKLLDRGFMGKKYENLENLEKDLNSALNTLYKDKKIKQPLKAEFVENGKFSGSIKDLMEVLDIVEKKLAS